MIEKTIDLDNITLIDFLGIENSNIKVLSSIFLKTKIISRGNIIKIQGTDPEIIRVYNMIKYLMDHYYKYGNVNKETIYSYLENDTKSLNHKKKDNVVIFTPKGIVIRPKTPNQEILIDAIKKNDLVFAIGPAGTGKTYLATAMAVKAFKNKLIRKIIITRPAVETGENLGFLPGDLKEKIDPYLKPIYDALGDMIPSEKLKFYLENNIIEIAPLAYMRGKTLNNAYVLLDEAQNTTNIQMKMFLTRMGINSKMIINGDTTQIDLPKNYKSGLLEAIEVLKEINEISIVELTENDVVRNKIVKKIISAYQKI